MPQNQTHKENIAAVSNLLSQHVLAINSLLNNRILIDARNEKPWRISLVKSLNKEHVFLLLEGIQDGKAVHLRADFFLDSDSKDKVRAKIPEKVALIINTLSNLNAEDYIGYGFVRTKNTTLTEYQKTLGESQYQSWPITQSQAEYLSKKLVSEARQPVGNYTYSVVPGNTPSRTASAGSGLNVDNCVSWSKDILKTVDINIGSYWAIVECPSEIIRQVQQETIQPVSSSRDTMFSLPNNRSSNETSAPNNITSPWLPSAL